MRHTRETIAARGEMKSLKTGSHGCSPSKSCQGCRKAGNSESAARQEPAEPHSGAVLHRQGRGPIYQAGERQWRGPSAGSGARADAARLTSPTRPDQTSLNAAIIRLKQLRRFDKVRRTRHCPMVWAYRRESRETKTMSRLGGTPVANSIERASPALRRER